MNAISQQIKAEIERVGPVSLARFMEIALYAPGLGYYERQKEIGKRGDFFTSVSVGPVFGELLAFQFVQWLDTDCPMDSVQLVEAGAHQGALAADILSWMEQWRPDVFARLEYWMIEPSRIHRQWQQEKLKRWAEKIKWVGEVTELGERGVNGIIFSNEFLDAMPVHQLAWDAGGKKWQERGVACVKGKFTWRLASPSAAVVNHLPQIEPALADVLPEGFIMEVSPPAVEWWSNAAKTLRCGKMMTIDYGVTAEERIRPERGAGTFRALARQHITADPLENPGDCDLTAHVNFSAIEQAGLGAGLTNGSLMEQSQFFTRVLEKIAQNPGCFAAWTPARLRQFHTLTHPEHLGHAFRVLIQEQSC